MSQTKTQSFIETITGVAIGYVVALLTQFAVFPLFGMKVAMGDNLLIGAIFTVVSIIRSYFVRRLFNRIHNGKAEKRQA